MSKRLRELKIKIKNLADEARTIREEEHKTSGMEKWGLQNHRKTAVRSAARANLLAYACLRGMPYGRVESKADLAEIDRRFRAYFWKRIEKIALTFGAEEEQIALWVADADDYLDGQEQRQAA